MQSGSERHRVNTKLAVYTETPSTLERIFLSMMERQISYAAWTEGENSTLLEEDFERANWARPRHVNLPLGNSSDRQDQTLQSIGARDAALGGLNLLLVATILGKADPMKAYFTHLKLLGILGPLRRPQLGPETTVLTNWDVVTQSTRVNIFYTKFL